MNLVFMTKERLNRELWNAFREGREYEQHLQSTRNLNQSCESPIQKAYRELCVPEPYQEFKDWW